MIRRPRFRGDCGVAGAEALALGVLVFLFGTLLVANVWAVIDAKMATTSAAREAARAFALADEAPVPAAWAAAERSLAAHGWPREASEALELDGAHERCAVVRARVTLSVEPIALPDAGFGHAFSVTSEHRERVDPLRGGLGGEVEPQPGATLCGAS